MSFDLSVDMQQQIRTAAHLHRLTLGELAERAFRRELQFLARRPIKRLKPGLRKGRPIKRPSRSPS
jgi:hypothetical protein